MAHLLIKLPNKFLQKHREAIRQYLINSKKLTKSQWQVAFEAFDLLKNATAQQGTAVYSFRRLYSLLVDKVYANPFLKRLQTMSHPEREGAALQAALAHKIVSQLSQSGWFDYQNAPLSVYLRAYCTYWWDSFAKGYLFEVVIYRSLEQSGVRFWAHDVTDPTQRYMPYDLIVSGWQGDIRTSTYFLFTTRTQTLKHAFYITRLWHRYRRKRVWAVVMQPNFWATIDGDTQIVKLSQAAERFPAVSQVNPRNQPLIVAEYTVWLTKILHYQETHHE